MTGIRRNNALNILLLLRAVRWYNVGLIVLAQYLTAFFVFHSGGGLFDIIYDFRLHLIVLSNSFALAGAFLINGFYDLEKDLVNTPRRVVLFRLLGQNLLLNVYAVTLVLSLLLALIASVKVFIFTSCLVFMYWFYSHKLQKLPLVREVTATLLAISPFAAVWLHFGTMHQGYLIYLGSLAIVGFTREVVKDLTGNTGNIIFGYQTVVVAAGQSFTTQWLVLVNVLLSLAFTTGFFTFVRDPGYFSVISGFSIVCTLLVSVFCYLARNQNTFKIADTILKSVIVIHLISLVFSAGISF